MCAITSPTQWPSKWSDPAKTDGSHVLIVRTVFAINERTLYLGAVVLQKVERSLRSFWGYASSSVANRPFTALTHSLWLSYLTS